MTEAVESGDARPVGTERGGDEPSWSDAAFVGSWVRQDGARTLLDLPRRIATAVVAAEGEPVRLVVDVAAGSGTFLAQFLNRFPDALGVWSDASGSMEEHACALLRAYGERTTFVIADMRELGALGLEREADVVCSSRGSHHLEDDELQSFYLQCAAMLRPGGWIVNLDHLGMSTAWARRWRAARAEVAAG